MEELGMVSDRTAAATIVEQLLAKLQRQQRKLGDSNRDNIEATAGMLIPEMINHLRQSDPQQVQEWFRQRVAIAQMLDARDGGRQPLLISRHADELRRIERGYGNAQKPGDYLDSFSAYLRENINNIPALYSCYYPSPRVD